MTATNTLMTKQGKRCRTCYRAARSRARSKERIAKGPTDMLRLNWLERHAVDGIVVLRIDDRPIREVIDERLGVVESI